MVATRRPGQREVDQDRRALARAVVLEVGGAEPAAVGQAVLGEVQGPALVGGDRAPGARQPAAEPALLPAAAADGQLLLAVEALHELVVRPPALAAQQRVQPPVAEPAPLAGQGTQALAQAGVVPRALGRALRHRARDPDQPASTATGEPMLLLGDRHRLPPCRRRRQFFASSPSSAWSSSIVSARSCLRRRFSSSSALSRLASETAIPAYFARHL
jgi:hypothetical protein